MRAATIISWYKLLIYYFDVIPAYDWIGGKALRITFSFLYFYIPGPTGGCHEVVRFLSPEISKRWKVKEDGNVYTAAAECWSWNDCPMDTAV